jgi:Fe-S-cluster containining protein
VAENDRFRVFVQERNNEQIDSMVSQLNEAISPRINCTSCGNCCKSLMVLISEEEANNLSAHLRQPRASFDEQYLEKGSNGLMIMNRMPCHFLSDNKCTVYEHRFEGCKEFPALHLPNFKKRLFTTFMHYERCPIIFNVVEELKNQMSFEKDGSL